MKVGQVAEDDLPKLQDYSSQLLNPNQDKPQSKLCDEADEDIEHDQN
jgi:hypothetical protein